MSRAVAVSFIALFVIAPSWRCGAATTPTWTCQAESTSATGTGGGDSRKDAEDAALASCAGKSARFSTCRIVACHRSRKWL